MQLLWWEFEQLIDHINSRTDIWSVTGNGRWLRTRSYDDDTALLGFALTGRSPKGTFQKVELQIIPLGFTAEEAATYFESLIEHWTDYGQRRRYERLLIDEGGVEDSKAGLLATALVAEDRGLLAVNSNVPPPRDLLPDVECSHILGEVDERVVRTFGVAGGGWLRLRFTNGMLKICASLPCDGRYGGGYSGVLEGVVRPSNGNLALTAAAMFGGDMPLSPAYEDSLKELVQQELRSVSDGDKYIPHIKSFDVLDVVDDGLGGPGVPAENTHGDGEPIDPPEPIPSSTV